MMLIGSAAAQEPNASSQPSALPPVTGPDATIPLSYVGSNGRIGIGVDQDGDVQGEALGVLGYNGERAFLAQGWLGNGGAGGVQADYHWLWSGRTKQDTISHPENVIVAKFFMALDRNGFDDRKGTVGFGLERGTYAFDAYYSRALTDERLVDSESSTRTETVFGEEGTRAFRQDVTIDTLIERFEHPYDQGFGMRLARFFDKPLLRLRGGLDYEHGDTLLNGRSASQLAASIALEKYFESSRHSFAVAVEHAHKDGPFDRSEFGGMRDDTRASLTWRYELGQPYRPLELYRERTITRTIERAPPPPEVHRTQLQLSSEALFEFDRAEVTAAARAQLRPLVQRIKEQRVGAIEIVGHTCDLGSDEYNQRLSEHRAEAVRDWLIAEGVPADALVASGRGEGDPQYPNDSEANRARNRRITLTFMTAEVTTTNRDPAPPQTIAEVVREPVPTAAPWIERALRSPAEHKRTVDTYRIERVTQRRTEGSRVFVNRPPAASDDSATTPNATAVVIAPLSNDRDPDGDVLQLASVGNPANGSAIANSDGTVTYTPNAGFSGQDRFSYAIRDGGGLTASASITVSVDAPPPNAAPQAVDDTVPTQFDTPVIIAVLTNDTDPDGDALQVTSAGPAANGTVVVNQDGTVTYAPNAGFAGADQFSYAIRDPAGATSTANVTVTVLPRPNRAPQAVDDDVGAETSVPTTFLVLGNDSDPDGDALRITAVGTPTLGTVVINPNGTLGYTPGPVGGTDTFTYTIEDSGGLSATATVRVNLLSP